MQRRIITSALLTLALACTAACGSDSTTASISTEAARPESADDPIVDTAADTVAAVEPVSDAEVAAPDAAESDAAGGETTTITAEVWADNWFSLWVNGELIGEDSVPITTERSFNAETFTFEAAYPLTIAIEAKDFKETDSGLEYIGEPNQQMGDGGLIAQFTDVATGAVIAATGGDWSTLVVHRAPLNTGCERDADPDATCEFEIVETPTDWASVAFDDSAWSPAAVWNEAAVGPKDGYDQISWDSSAALVWGGDLEIDNTVLLRTTVAG